MKGRIYVISFVILTWNSESTIIECLESIRMLCTERHRDYEILIVDNGSSDNTVSLLREKCNSLPVNLTVLDKNMGTTVSRNIVLRQAKGDVVCVMDSDVYFVGGDLDGAIALLNTKDIGLIAPKLTLSDGQIQNSVKKFPSLLAKLAKIPKIVFKLKVPNFDFYREFPFNEKTEVDYAISACWLFRREILDSVGYLDENIFYSPEDIDYCLRIRKTGKSIYYYPQLTAVHYTQQLTHKKVLSKQAISHFLSIFYYHRKHRYILKPKI